MARPKKDGLDYFPHDVDSLTDPKLEPAIMLFGANAYAFYFVHLEYCYKSKDLYIDVSDTEVGLEMQGVIQRKLGIPADIYAEILKCLLRHGAFDRDEYEATGHLTSNGIQKRAAGVFKKRANAAKSYEQSKSEEASGRDESEPNADDKSLTPKEQRDAQQLEDARHVYASLPKRVQSAVTLWLDYKKERRESYKPTAMLTLMHKVQKSVDDSGAAAVVEVITDSIASRYQGITWDKLRSGNGRAGTTNPFMDSDEEDSNDGE